MQHRNGEAMKVLHAQQYPIDPTRIPGGPFSAGYHLSHELAAMPDVEVSVVTVTRDVKKDLRRVDGNVPITFLARKRRRLVPNMLTDVPRIVQEIEKTGPDIVCAQLAVYGVAALRVNIPSVYLIHGVIHKEARVRKNALDRLLYLLYVRMDQAAVRGARHIIATSPYAVDEYRNITNARFHVLDNAVDDRYFDIQNRENTARLFLGGLIYDRKNILGALEIVRRLKAKYPNIVLSIGGRIADRKYYERCQAFVKHRRLEDNVAFLGQATTDQVSEELAACSMLLLTSSQETAPLIISEAMAAAKPVVSADVGGCRYLVEDGASGFVVPWDDTDAYVQRIETILDDADLRQRFGLRSREIAEGRFRRRIVAENTLAVYKEVLKRY
jgi:glycosyltransferase involved in cell wall biosynthesis